jgi:GH25 family lysozyme M1 (1,4-beta-N-acetylmuramidase)
VLTVIASATVGTIPALNASATAALSRPLVISRAEAESGSGAGADETVTGSIAVRAAEARLPYQSERR